MELSTTHRLRQLAFLVILIAFSWMNQGALSARDSDLCTELCGELADCNTYCIPGPEEPGTTCGEYDGGEGNGWCTEGGGSCTPNYVVIDEDVLGALDVDLYPTYCENNRYSLLTYHDNNDCEESEDYQLCLLYNFGSVAYPPAPDYCCSAYWCGGTFTCPI